MKCNRMINPIGFTFKEPRLSWITEADGATTQVACQIKVASDETFEKIFHDSGKSEGSKIDSIGYILLMNLKPCTRVGKLRNFSSWRQIIWVHQED